MPQNTHLELVSAEAERQAESPREAWDASALHSQAVELARQLGWVPSVRSSHTLKERVRALHRRLAPLLHAFRGPLPDKPVSDDFHWLHDNLRLVETELYGLRDAVKTIRKVPHVRRSDGVVVPRVAALAEGLLSATAYQFSEQAFSAYVEAYQETTVLKMKELWGLVSAMKLLLLEQIAARASQLPANPAGLYGAGLCVRSLRDVGQTSWKDVIEPLIRFDRVLRDDPAGAYPRMDFDSRELYREKLVKIADRSDFTEVEVALEALALAREAQQQPSADPRMALRQSHVGYYLLAEGRFLLYHRVAFRPSFGKRVQTFLLQHPNEYYLTGIEVLTFVIISAILLPLVGPYGTLGLIFLAMLALLLPGSQSAVQLMNYLTTAILPAQILPKLDFSDGVPEDCLTLVAVPSLLLSEKQVRQLTDDLEVRFLGNHDRHVHFALVTDLPDSREPAREDDPLVHLCAELIDALNAKYAARGMGSFFLFHRHRTYNPRERVWMGWERKRGKLLDLNKLLRNDYDSFPLKVGDLSILPKVRFVITLDSDTELPRGAAHRMIGALAHPLNQAIIDPGKNIVTAGYGILQPRVGVSVQSVARSRLASIYSGETGFDIYTRAISDIYQDLYGEGIFAGKGIYEVETLHQVLDRRFPRNSLLSHDLIEGAYARAGLATDIEVIEDYPSHYSAYNRRKHRWLRGDWQITGWLLSQVPDESGHLVPNPISIVSWWKILDNLRRSLVEPATFLLLVLGWLVLPGTPLYWTVATVCILFIPPWCQFIFSLVKAAVLRRSQVARDAVSTLFASNVATFLNLTFLAHQAFLSLDAVIRVGVRRVVTRQRLLEWETMAQAELGAQKSTPVDRYLNWIPALALALGAWVWLLRPAALSVALPILVLWGSSKFVSLWLNRPPRALRSQTCNNDQLFLRRAALRTWRYFAEFCTQEHNWLIPDNVQEEPAAIAPRVSPTNLGFLLNARQVACTFGYLTVPEFAQHTLRTLATVSKLPHSHGHLFNWYDTRTLEPLPPVFVSSVDSGNLLASLWTLQQGTLAQLHEPLLSSSLAEGLLDHAHTLFHLRTFSRKQLAALRRKLESESWLQHLLELPDTAFDHLRPASKDPRHTADVCWFQAGARARLSNIQQMVRIYAPWLLPRFKSLRHHPSLNVKLDWEGMALSRIPDFIDTLAAGLKSSLANLQDAEDRMSLQRELLALLPEARSHVERLIQDLRRIASDVGQLADEMDFRFLLDRRRKLLSAGFNVESQQLHSACYDLLASEARIAVFMAIAKDDVPQETWFLLGREHGIVLGRPVLLSWTGTMFEYLMPALWMRTFPNTLLERSRSAAVRAQQAYTAVTRIPWGISESAYFETDEAGNYQYYAFGIPQLALRQGAMEGLVISPYSTFLALHVDASSALRNLRKMASRGWFGSYGFYEAVDFTPSRRRSWLHRQEPVRCWMAHHQGMTLLSIANFLRDNIVQEWFHSDPRVQATELLLHEKPLTHLRPLRRTRGKAAA